MRLFALVTTLLLSAGAAAHHYQAGGLLIDHPWARATVPGADTGVVYLKIDNHGPQADALTAASNPELAQSIGLHVHINDHGVMRMREVSQIAIPAGSSVTLQPYGYHIMLNGLKHPLQAGQHLSLTLHFDHQGDVPVEVKVEAIDADASTMHMQ